MSSSIMIKSYELTAFIHSYLYIGLGSAHTQFDNILICISIYYDF